MRRLRTPFLAAVTAGLLGFLALEQHEAAGNYTLNASSWPSPTATWRANTNFPAAAGTTAEQLAALQAGADAWTSQACSNFQFNYLGTTSIAVSSNDGVNAVYHTATAGAGTLAVCVTRFSGNTTTSFDIRFYGDVTWDAVSPVSGEFDVQGVATHEFGHALGLGHDDATSSATMWPSTSSGNGSINWRSLHANDMAGAVALYGADPLCGAAGFFPDPMSFAQPPNPIAPAIVLLTATPAGPGTPEYLFDYTGLLPGGSDGVWQTSPTYVDSGLEPNALHTWRVKARLAASPAIETGWSPVASVVTAAATPGAPTISALGRDVAVIGGLATGANPASTHYAVQVAGQWVGASGALQGVEHWTTAAGWAGKTIQGLSPLTAYTIAAKARNFVNVQTPLGPATAFSTRILPLSAAGSVVAAGGAPESPFRINGSDGGTLRQVESEMGDPLSFEMMQPGQNPLPAAFIVWGRFGVPLESGGYDLPAGVGRLCHVPCDFLPLPESFLLFSTYGNLNCVPLAGSFPTPFALVHPGLNFPVIDLLLQGVVEQTPGVLRTTNAILLQNL